MGKFIKAQNHLSSDSNTEGINWQQLLVDYQYLSVEEAIENIMSKFTMCENIEFDQICLILKHYLMLENNAAYLTHFLQFNDCQYLSQMVDRFNRQPGQANVQWMISELFKLLSSMFNVEQTNFVLTRCGKLRNLLLNDAFSDAIIEKAKIPFGLNLTERTTIANIFDTISNLCEIKNDLVNFIGKNHIEWLTQSLLQISRTNTEMIASFCRLVNLIGQYSTNQENNALILDLFIKRNFLSQCIAYLNTDDNQNETTSARISQLYLIESLINLIQSSENFEKTFQTKTQTFLIQLLNDYSSLIFYSFKQDVIKVNKSETGQAEEDDAKQKEEVKAIENQIDSKLSSIEILTKIANNFSQDNNFDEDEEESEELDNLDEEEEEEEKKINDEAKMELEIDVNNQKVSLANQDEIAMLENMLKSQHLLDHVIQIICLNTEFLNEIEHLKSSMLFLKNECIQLYLVLMNNFSLNLDVQQHFVQLLQGLLSMNVLEDADLKFLSKLGSLIYDLFESASDKLNSKDDKLKLISLIRDILMKYNLSSHDLCVKMARIVAQISTKQRDQLKGGDELIQMSALILLELTSLTFQNKNGSDDKLMLKLNAELLDLIIDLFSEDYLKDIELKLGFVAKMREFSDRFYSNYRQLVTRKKAKLTKDSSLIIKTVKDNLRNFVDYKIKNSK